MASRLEASTKEYGVTILISEELVKACSPDMAWQCRPVDHVFFKGNRRPTRVFTVDLDWEVLTINTVPRRKSKNRYQQRMEREKRKALKFQDDWHVSALFHNDKDVKNMRERYFLSFFQEFEKGYLNYEAGEWDVAVDVFNRTRVMLCNDDDGREDGPSQTLLRFMQSPIPYQTSQEHSRRAPSNWPGYRELDY